MSATESEMRDPALLGEVDLARAAAQEEAGDEEVGAHVGTTVEADTAVTHLFEAAKPGYYGWRWAVILASAGPDTDVTVSEVVLRPGPDALVAPDWVPWENRVKAGDLGVGDLLPTAPDDPRLVPAYVGSDDPAVEEVAHEAGLGRQRVMARPARLEAATRWQHSEFGPRSDMARGAPAHCGTCGFYLPLAGSLRAAFGTCGNEISPADGHVVHAEYGCGAHSEAEVEQVSPVLVANLIYDDARLDVEVLPADAAPEQVEAGQPRELSAAEALPAESPPAAEPVAPIEAVVTAETSIDTPGRAEDVARAPGPDGLLSGGLLSGGLLSGGLLRGGAATHEAPTQAGHDVPADREVPADEVSTEDDTSAEADAPIDGDAPGNGNAFIEDDSAEDSALAEDSVQTDDDAFTEVDLSAEDTVADDIALAEGSTPSEADATSEDSAPHEDSTPAEENVILEGDSIVEDSTLAEGHAASEGDTGEAGSAHEQEHPRWEPSFRPYWMRSAGERRTEGD
jgi:hypothetical protein